MLHLYSLYLESLTKETQDRVINFVLNFKSDSSDEKAIGSSALLKNLLLFNLDALECVSDNPNIAAALLNKFSENLKEGKLLPEIIALAINDISFDNIKQKLKDDVAVFDAVIEFNTYLGKAGKNIDFDTFNRLFKITGFYPTLLKLHTEDITIKRDLIKESLCGDYFSFLYQKCLPWGVKNWLEEIFKVSPDNELKELIHCFPGEKQTLLNELIVFNEKDNELGKLQKFLRACQLLRCDDGQKIYLTGAFLSQIYCNKEVMSFLFTCIFVQMSKSHNHPVDWKDLSKVHALLKSSESQNTKNERLTLLNEFVNLIRKGLSKKYITGYGPVIDALESDVFKEKTAAWENFEQYIDKLNHKQNDGVNSYATILELYAILETAGVDEEAINLLATAKGFENFQVGLKTLLEKIMPSSEAFSESLKRGIQKRINLIDLGDEKKELFFLEEAKLFIHENRDAISGTELYDLYQKFNGSILPVIQKYKLEGLLNNAISAANVITKINESKIVFEKKEIDHGRGFQEIKNEIQILVDESDDFSLFHNKGLPALFKKLSALPPDIGGGHAQKIMNACSVEQPENLFRFTVNMAVSGIEYSLDQLVNLLNKHHIPREELCGYLAKKDILELLTSDRLLGEIDFKKLLYTKDQFSDALLTDESSLSKLRVAHQVNPSDFQCLSEENFWKIRFLTKDELKNDKNYQFFMPTKIFNEIQAYYSIRIDNVNNYVGDEKWKIRFLKISDILPKNLAEFELEQIQELTSTQVSSLKKNLIQALKERQVSWLTKTQAQALTSEQILWLSETQTQALTPKQIPWLSKTQIQALTADQISWLSNAQVQALAPDQIPWLSKTQILILISKLTKKQKETFTPKQKFCVDTEAQIKKLTSKLNRPIKANTFLLKIALPLRFLWIKIPYFLLKDRWKHKINLLNAINDSLEENNGSKKASEIDGNVSTSYNNCLLTLSEIKNGKDNRKAFNTTIKRRKKSHTYQLVFKFFKGLSESDNNTSSFKKDMKNILRTYHKKP